MLGLIIAIRNFFIALILGWIGISFSAPNQEADYSSPEDTTSLDDVEDQSSD